MNPQEKARQRATMILKVRSGQLTATQAARSLRISRQRYYQWERRALQAMLSALASRPKGRPKNRPPDLEKQLLRRRMQELQKRVQVYESKERLRSVLKQIEESPTGRGSSQKKTRNGSSDLKRNGKGQSAN